MKKKVRGSFENDLYRYTLAVVRDLLLCTVTMSALCLILFISRKGDYYYIISLVLFLSSIVLFIGLSKGGKGKKYIVNTFAVLTPLVLLLFLLIDDFVFPVKPLVYLFFFFFIVEIVRIGFLLRDYLEAILRKQKNYKIAANFENRNNLLGKVSRSLLHDIATPVSILSGSLELLERRKLDKIESKIFQTNVKVAVNQIEAILHSTDFLMKNSSFVVNFTFNECIDEIITLLQSRINDSCIVVEKTYQVKDRIYGDRNVFLRVFLNVFLNAIEELEKRESEIRRISIRTFDTPNSFCVSICDNGNGLDPALRVMLNSEGFALSRKTMDIGSGLIFIKYGMREIFNGKIRIDYNQKEHRNCFKLYFPRK